MKWLTLERVKKHLRLDASNTQEDDLLQLYATAAEDTILNLCNRSYDCLLECYGEVPKPIVNASLLLVENQYTQRSVVSPTNLSAVPYSFDLLVKPYMIL
jgi:uncharacterized phage protein (predicted DNA packaging)